MAEILGKGAIVDDDALRELYVEDVVGIHTFEQNVVITFAVNRVELGKGVDAKSRQHVVLRLAMPFKTANDFRAKLNLAAQAVTLDTETSGVGH